MLAPDVLYDNGLALASISARFNNLRAIFMREVNDAVLALRGTQRLHFKVGPFSPYAITN